jgi:putative nucleotidyltransferase with HDIG domain
MDRLPQRARWYVTAVIGLGAILFFSRLAYIRVDEPLLFLLLTLLSSAAAALKVKLPLTSGGSTMSVSYAVDFASLLALGSDATMVVAASSAFAQSHLNNKRERSPLHRTLFNIASLVVTVQGAGLAFRLLAHAGPENALTTMARPLVGAATVYFLLNTGLIATAISLSSNERITTTWYTNFLWSAPSYFVGAGTAALALWLIEHAGWWVTPLTFAPVYLMYRTYKLYMGRVEDEQRHVQQTSDLHLATIEALARAIDAKDQHTQTHIRRVQLYAVGLAKAAGLGPADIQAVKTAALLHDIGKLAVPEHILTKPGRLTADEFQAVRLHPSVGAEIIKAVPFPYPVAPLIESHHERWDGSGYPSAIARDEYPRDRTTALAKGVGKRTEQALLDTLRRTELQIQAIGQISLAEEILSGDVEGLARRITELAAGVVGCERVNVEESQQGGQQDN